MLLIGWLRVPQCAKEFRDQYARVRAAILSRRIRPARMGPNPAIRGAVQIAASKKVAFGWLRD